MKLAAITDGIQKRRTLRGSFPAQVPFLLQTKRSKVILIGLSPGNFGWSYPRHSRSKPPVALSAFLYRSDSVTVRFGDRLRNSETGRPPNLGEFRSLK